MDIIKLLDVSSPKTIKDTLNSLIEHYTELEADINATAGNALAKSEEAVNISNAATTSAANAVQTSNAAQQTSNEAKQIAEESLAISSQAEATADDAKILAEDAFLESDEANLTSESALNIATDALDKVQHALETGATGTLIHDTDNNFLVNMYRSDDVSVEDTDLTKYILTPSAVRTALNSYLPLSGGTMSGVLKTKYPITGTMWSTTDGIYFGPGPSGIVGNSMGRLGIYSGSGTYFKVYDSTHSIMDTTSYRPNTNNAIDLGTSSYKWKSIYGTAIYQNGKQVAAKDASNLTSLNIASWKTKLGVGEVSGVVIRRWE